MASSHHTYKETIAFLIKFIGIYVIANVFYGLAIEYYHPSPDPITKIVSQQVAAILNSFAETVSLTSESQSPYIRFITNGKTIIRAFEGCNGVNVMIVYLSFIIAFKGNLKSTILFLFIGLVIIHVMNLFRVGLLYEIALRFPNRLYFFHKYFFTALLYVIVFVLWYFWVKQTNKR